MMYIFLSFLVVCMVYISYVIFDIIGQKKFSKDNDYPFTIVFSLDVILFFIGFFCWYLFVDFYISLVVSAISIIIGLLLVIIYRSPSNKKTSLPVVAFILGVTTAIIGLFTFDNYRANYTPSYSSSAIASLEHMISYYKTGSTAVAYIQNDMVYLYPTKKLKGSESKAVGLSIDPFAFNLHILQTKYNNTASEFEKIELTEQAQTIRDNGDNLTAFYMLKGSTGYVHNIKIKNRYYSFLAIKDSDDSRDFANTVYGINVKKQVQLIPADIKEFKSYPNAIDIIQKISKEKINQLTGDDDETKISYKSLLNIMNFGSAKHDNQDYSDSSQSESSSSTSSSSATSQSQHNSKEQLSLDKMENIAKEYVKNSKSSLSSKDITVDQNNIEKDGQDVVFTFNVKTSGDSNIPVKVNSYTGSAYSESIEQANGNSNAIPTFSERENDLLNQINKMSSSGDFRKGAQAPNQEQASQELYGTYEMDFTNLNNQNLIVRIYLDMLTLKIVHHTEGEFPEIIPEEFKGIQ
ncbi:hypothetical protein [Leuconostoc mesenteroides]|uniref:hypothetical protein n=4 Tax=Leuconostoc mesenteroides TaxID=1245 RepID=UPI00235F0780|nr:hypothetical protein [Leuconostoc mesenteroides]